MRLSYPLIIEKTTTETNMYPLIEFLWHSVLPLIILYASFRFSSFFVFFLLIIFIRIRENE